jgi:hypothetical protein
MDMLAPHESLLVGTWIRDQNGNTVSDDTEKRIEWLIGLRLTRLATNEFGTLDLDNADGRKWDLTYARSARHGYGPATLTCVSDEIAKTKYGIGKG